jgi:hypothetical protein
MTRRAFDGAEVGAPGKIDDDGRELVAGQSGSDGDPSWLLILVCIHRSMNTEVPLPIGLTRH